MKHKIGFLSVYNPMNRKTWSGISFKLYQYISKEHAVEWVEPSGFSTFIKRVLWLREKINDLFHLKFTAHYYLYSYQLGKSIQKKLKEGSYDVLVVGAGETELISCLSTDIPIIYIGDSTFANMVDYYDWHTGLCRSALYQGNKLEKRAIDNSTHLMYSSDWARQSAIRDYGAFISKTTVQPFGANIDFIPGEVEIFKRENNRSCKLLFLAVDWKRKGGQIALDAFTIMQSAGLECSLTIVGCKPFIPENKSITVIENLDKNKENEMQILCELLLTANFLFIPTRADCTPIVFSEAASFGLPVITTNTGGVSEIIHNGVNGYCLPLDADADDYAEKILEVWKNKELYHQLIIQSKKEYNTRLNWETWLQQFNKVLVGNDFLKN